MAAHAPPRFRIWSFQEVRKLEDHQIGFSDQSEQTQSRERFLRRKAQLAVFGTYILDLPRTYFASLKEPDTDHEAQLACLDAGFDLRTDRGAIVRDWLFYWVCVDACLQGMTKFGVSEIAARLALLSAQRLEGEALHWKNTRGSR